MSYNGVWWRCEICEAYLPNEPAVTLHFLEKHDENILLRDDVRLEPLRIVLPTESEFWSAVQLSMDDVALNEEDICEGDEEVDDEGDGYSDEGRDDKVGEFHDRDDANWTPRGQRKRRITHHESEEDDDNEQDGDGDEDDDKSDEDESHSVDASGKLVVPPPTSVVHPCYSCAATFDTTEKLNTHRKKHIGEKPFACDTCDKKFAFYTLCEMHKLQHTPEWPELRKDTKKLAELKRQFILNRRNWRMRLYQPPVRKQCPQCPRSFKWAAGLERHLRWHRNERSFICTTCGSAYRFYDTLRTHLRSGKCAKVILTSFSRAFQCEVCPARLKSEKGLRTHKKNLHGLPHKPRVKQRLTCPQCSYVTTSALTLQNHLNSHSGLRPFLCPTECGAAFTMRTNMLAHVRKNCRVAKKTGLAEEYEEQRKGYASKRRGIWGKVPGGVSCPECDKICPSVGKLKVHRRTHDIGKLKCEICGVRYQHRATLGVHRKTAHPEVLVHPCNQCEGWFEDVERLKIHARIVHRKGVGGEHVTPSTVVIHEVELEEEWKDGFDKGVDPLGGCA